ncbi:ABC-three component system middle component 6 [Streptomyces sp. NPDC057199]|uniref:ABC-three component system middle component 6 n=1 Tax=Streptomyces sp. NPDC057199 TaxID=3346047 RepID=UPI0036437850
MSNILLPNKHVRTSESLLAHTAGILQAMRPRSSVAQAWSVCKEKYPEYSYPRFVLVMDTLMALGLIELDGDVLMKMDSYAA